MHEVWVLRALRATRNEVVGYGTREEVIQHAERLLYTEPSVHPVLGYLATLWRIEPREWHWVLPE